MDNQTQPKQFSQPELPTKLGDNVPEYIKKRLATAMKSDAEKAEETPQPSDDVPENPSPNDETESKTQQTEPSKTDVPEHHQDENDVKAWKGRLNKEQTAHQETSRRLLEEAEARKKAEQERAALEKRLAELEQAKSQSKATETPSTETPKSDPIFTDAEINELGFGLGNPDLARKLADVVARSNHLPKTVEMPDVNKIVEERFKAMQQQQSEQQRAELFGKTLLEKVPNFQSLVNNAAFIEFTNEKEIDFTGNKASALLNYAGQSKDLSVIPQIERLVAEFEQSQQPPKETVTAAPSSKSAVVNTQPKAKPKMTDKDIAYKNRLARLGKTAELRAFLAKFSN